MALSVVRPVPLAASSPAIDRRELPSPSKLPSTTPLRKKRCRQPAAPSASASLLVVAWLWHREQLRGEAELGLSEVPDTRNNADDGIHLLLKNLDESFGERPPFRQIGVICEYESIGRIQNPGREHHSLRSTLQVAGAQAGVKDGVKVRFVRKMLIINLAKLNAWTRCEAHHATLGEPVCRNYGI